MRNQIPLGEVASMVEFTLKDGRRHEAIAAAQVANAVQAMAGINQAILAQAAGVPAAAATGNAQVTAAAANANITQQLAAINDPSAAAAFSASRSSQSAQQFARRSECGRLLPLRYPRRRGLPAGDHHIALGHEHVGHGRDLGRPPLCAHHRHAAVLVDRTGADVQFRNRRSDDRRKAAAAAQIGSSTKTAGVYLTDCEVMPRRPPACARPPRPECGCAIRAIHCKSLPCSRAAGNASRSSGANSPAFSRSTAIAPITALSVQRAERRDVQLDAARCGTRFPAAAAAHRWPPRRRPRKAAAIRSFRSPPWISPPGSRPRPLESWPPDRRSVALESGLVRGGWQAAGSDSARPFSAR